MTQTLLITGGAGFIGSHLADALLDAGYAVRVLDDLSSGRLDNLRPEVDVHRGDVTDPACLRRAVQGTSGIFHLAAIASVARSNEDPIGTHRVNMGGTVAVLDAARAVGRLPVVYASSAAIYGDQGDTRIDETARLAPMTAYGADKLGSELHAHVAAHVHGVPTLGLRFFNVYGPRQDPQSPYSGVIGIFAGRACAGVGLVIEGDGAQRRDFVFVADAVQHLLAAYRHLGTTPANRRPGALNVCTGIASSIAELAAQINQAALCTVPITYAPARAGDIRNSCGDPALATRTLGIGATTMLRDGLRHTLAALDPTLPQA